MKLLFYLHICGMKNQTKVDEKSIFKSWKLTHITLTGIPTPKLDIKYGSIPWCIGSTNPRATS